MLMFMKYDPEILSFNDNDFNNKIELLSLILEVCTQQILV